MGQSCNVQDNNNEEYSRTGPVECKRGGKGDFKRAVSDLSKTLQNIHKFERNVKNEGYV